MDRRLETLKTMLSARGRTAADFDTLGSPLDETKMYTFDGVLIIFSSKNSLSEKELQTFLTFSQENNYRSGMIVVTPNEPSEAVLNTLCSHIENQDNPLVQIFTTQKLQFGDVLVKHKIYSVPHRLLNDVEKNELTQKFPKPEKTFPPIWCQDPQAKWIGARPGDIIEISGWCPASGINTRWRFCVTNING
jgi:DNA-directed RNA polymerase subunit H (RpoH/RPB5)